MKHIMKMVALLAVTISLAACGGGGGGGGSAADNSTPITPTPPAPTPPAPTPPGATTKTATVAFSVISTAKLPAPISGVEFSAFLPVGTSVATDAGSNTISSSALTASSGITSTSLMFATYSAPIRKVKIAIITTGSTFRGGEVGKLTVSFPSTTTLTANDFTSLNSPFQLFQATGYDTVTHGTFDLSLKLLPSLGVTFN